MPIAPPPIGLTDPTAEERQALSALTDLQRWGSGYLTLQATRPQTLGYGLADSPAGQLAWIVEKFWSWMDCAGHPENALTRGELLDIVTLYWVTSSSARMYWESSATYLASLSRVELPTGIAVFPKEVMPAPRKWCEDRYHITRWTTMTRGGHFAALEQPELFVDDVRAFFATVR
jgi:pimeloyl-ACP methyl ester carboxylesterase